MIEVEDDAPTRATLLPGAQHAHECISSKFILHNLGYREQVRDECGLEDDWHVGGIEEFDGVGVVMVLYAGRNDGEVDLESLQEHD